MICATVDGAAKQAQLFERDLAVFSCFTLKTDRADRRHDVMVGPLTHRSPRRAQVGEGRTTGRVNLCLEEPVAPD